MSAFPHRMRRHHQTNHCKSDEENEDPFSPQHPENKQFENGERCKQQIKRQNSKTKHEWDANRSIDIHSLVKFKLNIGAESDPIIFNHYNELELSKSSTYEIWLTVILKRDKMIDINLYGANDITFETNTLTIFIRSDKRDSNLRLRDATRQKAVTKQQNDNALILIYGNPDMAPFFEFVLYLHENKPRKEEIPHDFNMISFVDNKKQSTLWRSKRNRNANGYTYTPTSKNTNATPNKRKMRCKTQQQRTPINLRNRGHKYANNAMDIDVDNTYANNTMDIDEDNNIEHCDYRDKHAYSGYLDCKYNAKTSHGRATLMAAAAQDPQLCAAKAAEKRHQQIAKHCVISQSNHGGKSKGGFMQRKGKTTRRNRNGNKKRNRNRNIGSALLSTKYSSGRSGDQIGFKNLGNTCYLNAILRSITSLECLTNDLRRKYVLYLGGETLNTNKCLYRTYLELLFRDLKNKNKSNSENKLILNPSQIKTVIGSMERMFASSRQQDAHELLSFFLNAFHDEIYGAMHMHMAQGRIKEELKCLSPIHSNFDFEIEFEYECTQCGYKRNKIESFREMSLDLPLYIDSNNDELKGKLIEQTNGGCPVHHMQHIGWKRKLSTLFMYCTACNNAELGHMVSPNHHNMDRDRDVTDFNGNRIHNWTLNDLLRAYFVKKVLEYKCEYDECCNNKVYVTSWFKRIPRVLVLHIKRFIANYATNSYTKSHDKIRIENTLDINLFCNETLSLPPSLSGSHPLLHEHKDSLEMYQDISDLPQKKMIICDEKDDDDIEILNNKLQGKCVSIPPLITSESEASQSQYPDIDIFTKAELKEKEKEWCAFDPNWRNLWTKDKCEECLKSHEAKEMKQNAQMFQKYWTSIEFHGNQHNRKRKREEGENGSDYPNKRQRIDSSQNKHDMNGALVSFGLNHDDNDAVDYDEKCSEDLKPKQPKITDMFQKQQNKNKKQTHNELECALAASIKTANQDEEKRKKRQSDSNDDNDDDNLKQALAQSMLCQTLSDLCNENKVLPMVYNGDNHYNIANINEFEPVCDESLLPNNIKHTQFNLKSIVHHLGANYQCGHYICDVLHKNNVWKRHDDQYVSSITQQIATNDRAQKNAYILFYVHQSAHNEL